MKYLYCWDDWGLFHVSVVRVIENNLKDYRYHNELFARVMIQGTEGREYPAIIQQKHLFDTFEEAYEYGLKETPSGAFI